MPALDDIDVIAPNLKRRVSGVTASVFSVVPAQNHFMNVSVLAPELPQGMPRISWWSAIRMPRDRWRIWHARRNHEMIAGLLLRSVLRRKYRVVFTCADARGRSGFTDWLISKCDGVVATSANVRPRDDAPMSIVVPHGVDTDVFHPDWDRAPNAQNRVACVGRVRSAKGTQDFVRALCAVLPSRPDWSAVILGRVDDADFAEGLRSDLEAAGVLDRVRFDDGVPVSTMPDFYRTLDLLVAPSHVEGFGLTPIEAAGCGVPAIATRGVGGFDDAIVHGESGALFDKGNVDDLAQQLATFMDDDVLRANAEKAARDHVVARYAIDVEARTLCAFYERVLTQKA